MLFVDQPQPKNYSVFDDIKYIHYNSSGWVGGGANCKPDRDAGYKNLHEKNICIVVRTR
jgi:hypothetical protein